MKNQFEAIKKEIENHQSNSLHKAAGYVPVFTAHTSAKIAIIGQAPGIKAQLSQKPWDDVSGNTLRKWLQVTDEQFYNEKLFAFVPMDFYYPGNGKGGDMPPRKDFAPLWHSRIFNKMPLLQLKIVVGSYSQSYYLKDRHTNVATNVTLFTQFLPEYFPLPHPSPRNRHWLMNNKWFELTIIPELQRIVKRIILN